MEPLKNMFTKSFIETFGEYIGKNYNDFDENSFLSNVIDENWETKELKDRYQHIANVLWNELLSKKDYSESVDILIAISKELKQQDRSHLIGFEYMFLPTCIEFYGLDYFEESMRGLKEITKLISAEFAIRSFYIRYPVDMLKQTLAWSLDGDEDVKRLASEGCRPSLPWGIALQQFKKNPKPLIPILENLKNDDSLYVRKSVANNLNDISKTHPEVVISLATKWIGKTDTTDWLIKHACRTLLKSGNTEVMGLFGYVSPEKFTIQNFSLPSRVKNGEGLDFNFYIHNDSSSTVKLRLEYVVYFMRKRGEHNSKVFMISDKIIDGYTGIDVSKSYSFRPISTRVYYPGIHKLGIKVNGEEIICEEFELID